MFGAMLNFADFDQYDLRSLRTGIMAGAPCPIELMKEVVSKMHLDQMTIAYGMTETSPVSFQSAVDDPIERRVSTVGRIQPHVEARIVDESGEIVRVGEQGELHTKGYLVMRGYWEDSERTAESIDNDGWMHTGDLATIDAAGYCNIVGRVKDMLIRGGENIYPREIEEFLLSHPEIQDVQVFGVPDKKYGEEICAWIIPVGAKETTLDEVRSYCDGQIAHYKVPRYVKIVSEFPMTVTGKPQKFLMREAMAEELSLEQVQTA
jgi:fatty-acyl-CoA synthase